MNKFLEEVLAGLKDSPKHLSSKYFYDEAGDKLFQQIMASVEYYPTKCEMEIFSQQTEALATTLKNGFNDFDLIEMGAGDATKSIFLLQQLVNDNVNFTYCPIDISKSMIAHLEEEMPKRVPGLKIMGLNGEYFHMLEKAAKISSKRKVVLFLGSNIGNIPIKEAEQFCKDWRSHLQKGDLVLVGFDLKKNPKTIRAAYNDAEGYTRDFNLNLLKRINRELDADFDLSQFEHYPMYDPESGACKSYLISLKEQTVRIGEADFFHFKENEFIFMEISQKYSLEETDKIALSSGFKPIKKFMDSKNWFLDTVWECV
ncbi:MAG: L-histidine N(alpha)-methyltransferase [Bacteroidetes bacterium]|nr:L-histidine N(alpha)-methyltransferase [Bacteroidota bacterium]MBU1371780.1 L-histidine N(alpha)-methyltransferase [Bacteroidota bacterium]MBU1485366.1 L-histidine N(alpha)-methyltransferase [Bacteroidota bacterium]MBU1760234.1 L-histidine N(alpha)-methyltransferase [Bacteroidota bacterium]MBU2266667.1 L-histidine N(alpha)-methyltransferase [Bacteroidota bacterium]